MRSGSRRRPSRRVQPQQRPSWIIRGGIIFAVLMSPLFVMGLFYSATSGNPTPKPPAAAERAAPKPRAPAPAYDCRDDTLRASFAAQQSVRQALEPKSAAFNRRLIVLASIGDCEWMTRGHVDTVNALNAPIRRWWVVRVRYERAPKRWMHSAPRFGAERDTLEEMARALQ